MKRILVRPPALAACAWTFVYLLLCATGHRPTLSSWFGMNLLYLECRWWALRAWVMEAPPQVLNSSEIYDVRRPVYRVEQLGLGEQFRFRAMTDRITMSIAIWLAWRVVGHGRGRPRAAQGLAV